MKNFFKNAVSKSKNFFEKIWNNIKNFVSKHKLLLERILNIAWALLMLYIFSGAILSGIEMTSAILITFAVAGYIFVAWDIYLVTFYNWNKKDLLEKNRLLWKLSLKQSTGSIDKTLSDAELRISMLEQKLKNDQVLEKLNDIEGKLKDIDRKIKEK